MYREAFQSYHFSITSKKLLMKKLILSLFLSCPFWLIGQATPTLEAIIKQHAQATGGVKNWKNLQSHIIVEAGEGINGNFSLTRSMKMPNRYRIDYSSKNMLRTKGFNGQNGWIILNGEWKEMSRGEEKEMEEETEFYGELPLALESGHQLELLGEQDLEGKRVYQIKMTKTAIDEQIYYVNAENYMLEMVTEYSEDKAFEGVLFKTVFEDYQEVEGLMFPFITKLFGNDRLLATYTIQDIKTNVPIEDELFMSDDEIVIRKNILAFSKALIQQDYDFATHAYTSDAKIFPMNTPIMEGSEAIRDYWTPQEGSKSRITYHKIIPEEIRIIGDYAYDYGYYEGRSINARGEENPWQGKYVIVWRKVESGEWKMELDIWNRVK